MGNNIFLLITLTITLETSKREGQLWPPLGFLIAFSIIFYFVYKKHIDFNFNLNFKTVSIEVIVYIVIGIFWSFFKWGKLVSRRVSDYLEYKKLMEISTSYAIKTKEQFIPEVSENKEQVSSWILFWPLSIIRYLLSDLLIDLGKLIIRKLTIFYDNITKSQFNKL